MDSEISNFDHGNHMELYVAALATSRLKQE